MMSFRHNVLCMLLPMARVKEPPNKSDETKDRFEFSPANDGERVKESKSINLPCSNLVDSLSIALNSQHSGSMPVYAPLRWPWPTHTLPLTRLQPWLYSPAPPPTYNMNGFEGRWVPVLLQRVTDPTERSKDSKGFFVLLAQFSLIFFRELCDGLYVNCLCCSLDRSLR